MNPLDRYLRLVHWLRKRYTGADGFLVLGVGGEPSAFSRIELAASRKLLGATK